MAELVSLRLLWADRHRISGTRTAPSRTATLLLQLRDLVQGRVVLPVCTVHSKFLRPIAIAPRVVPTSTTHSVPQQTDNNRQSLLCLPTTKALRTSQTVVRPIRPTVCPHANPRIFRTTLVVATMGPAQRRTFLTTQPLVLICVEFSIPAPVPSRQCPAKVERLARHHRPEHHFQLRCRRPLSSKSRSMRRPLLRS